MVFSSDVDEKTLSDVSFYCYDGGSGFGGLNGKSVLMLRELGSSRVVSDDHDLSVSVSGVGFSSGDLGLFCVSDVLSGPKDTAWPMQSHDTHHTGRSMYSTLSNNGAELWRFKCSWIEGGSVVDSDGTIYFGDYSGPFYALNPDGSLKWVFNGFSYGSSISSVPALAEDGTIYVGSWDHYLYALNSDGTLKWKFKAGNYASIIGSPAIGDDGAIYFGSTGLANQTDEIGRIFAVNPDGTEKWRYQVDYKISSSPAIADDGTVYIGSGDSYLYAMNPDGTLQWRFKTGHYIKGPPSIADDGTIYIGSYDGFLYALFPDGSLKWKCRISYGTESNPSMGPDGTIYVGGNDLYAVNPDGTLKWVYELDSQEIIFQSSPAVSTEGIVYVGTNIGGTRGGDIIAVNPDGTLRWRHRLSNSGWVDSSPCIDENGIVYIGSSEANSTDFFGHLYAFGPGEVNNQPDTPMINGPSSGKPGESITFEITGSDPDDDIISFYVDWGDGSSSGWQGPFASGSTVSLSHSWENKGSFTVKAKIRDDYGSESSWSTFEVTMPKNKYNLFDSLILRFFNNRQRFSR
jgi:outer membrane protein assembly factor BamB